MELNDVFDDPLLSSIMERNGEVKKAIISALERNKGNAVQMKEKAEVRVAEAQARREAAKEKGNKP
jgi:F0F1-type ATP synthase membrane subunit b/b'